MVGPWTVVNTNVNSSVTMDNASRENDERSHLAFVASLLKKCDVRILSSLAKSLVVECIAAAYTLVKKLAMLEIVEYAHLTLVN